MRINNKIWFLLITNLCLSGYVQAESSQVCQTNPSSQQCTMTHPHFFFDNADLSYDSKLGYQKKISDGGAVGVSAVTTGSFKGSLNFTNWNPDNTSETKKWVENDILQTYYETYTNPVSWSGDRMKNTNGSGSKPGSLRYAFMFSALKVTDNSNNAVYICRNVVIARGDDNWWVFQNDGERPKDGPGLYCYLNSSVSPGNSQTYDISLLGGAKSTDIDGEEVYKMKIKIEQHNE